MPTYEYRCPGGHRFERFQKMTDEPRAECPVCGGSGERILSGGGGFLFKGGGFYVTDYRSESYRKAASREESSTTSSKGDPGGAGGESSSPKPPRGKGTRAPSKEAPSSREE